MDEPVEDTATALTRIAPMPLTEVTNVAEHLVNSGFFTGIKDISQAIVKILAGREMGFPPIASMMGINIIEGRPELSSNLVAAALKRAGYTWKIPRKENTGCTIILYLKGELVGETSFDLIDAKRAGLLGKYNWQRYPRAMCFSRCMYEMARTWAPEVFGGIPPYSAEEIESIPRLMPIPPPQPVPIPAASLAPIEVYNQEQDPAPSLEERIEAIRKRSATIARSGAA